MSDEAPIPMLLWCPLCGTRHVDKGVMEHRPHKTHACQSCGLNWKPAMVPTVGVQYLPGCKDAPSDPAPKGHGAPAQTPCPSEDCEYCTGEDCRKCGPGPHFDSPCEHDVIQRHDED